MHDFIYKKNFFCKCLLYLQVFANQFIPSITLLNPIIVTVLIVILKDFTFDIKRMFIENGMADIGKGMIENINCKIIYVEKLNYKNTNSDNINWNACSKSRY